MHDPLTVALAAGAGLGVALTAACLVALHLLPTGLHVVQDAVSLYGTGKYAAWYRGQVIAAGCAALLLVAALARIDAGAPLPLAALALYGLARIAIARYPTDLEGAPLTPTGRRHVLLAAIAFLAIGLTAPFLGHAIASLQAAPAPADLLPALGLIVSASALATFVAGSRAAAGLHVFGLVERLFYASSLAFLLDVAVSAVELAR